MIEKIRKQRKKTADWLVVND